VAGVGKRMRNKDYEFLLRVAHDWKRNNGTWDGIDDVLKKVHEVFDKIDNIDTKKPRNKVVFQCWDCGTGGAQFFKVLEQTSKMMVIQELETRSVSIDPPYNQFGKDYAGDKLREGSKPMRVAKNKYPVWDGHGVDYYPD
jgi:hypothetical protein